jgi:hypothetical protein
MMATMWLPGYNTGYRHMVVAKPRIHPQKGHSGNQSRRIQYFKKDVEKPWWNWQKMLYP